MKSGVGPSVLGPPMSRADGGLDARWLDLQKLREADFANRVLSGAKTSRMPPKGSGDPFSWMAACSERARAAARDRLGFRVLEGDLVTLIPLLRAGDHFEDTLRGLNLQILNDRLV